MARRITALLGMIVLLGLVLMLVWRVWEHHERTDDDDREPAIVRLVTQDRLSGDRAVVKISPAFL